MSSEQAVIDQSMSQVEINEMSDIIKPMSMKKDFENKAFELEDLSQNNDQQKQAQSSQNLFDRIQRPGSMYSIRSSASGTSRSSVNSTSGRVRCPNLRLQKFFSYSGVKFLFYKIRNRMTLEISFIYL
jgi:hypothetical protein